MSEWKRISKAAQAYVNKGIDEIERYVGKSPEESARDEMAAYLESPAAATTQGGQVQRPQPQTPKPSDQSAKARQQLRVAEGATADQIQEAYDKQDKRIQKLIRECNKKIKAAGSTDEAAPFQVAKEESQALRAKLKDARDLLLSQGNAIANRFRQLEVDQPASAKVSPSSAKTSARKKRFQSLEID